MTTSSLQQPISKRNHQCYAITDQLFQIRTRSRSITATKFKPRSKPTRIGFLLPLQKFINTDNHFVNSILPGGAQ